MAKMPSLDDLKKMGAGLVDTARSVKINEMVDRVKSGVEAVSSSLKKDPASIPQGDEAIKQLFQALYAALSESKQLQLTQSALIKSMENQVSQLARLVDATQGTPLASTDQHEEKQNHENNKS